MALVVDDRGTDTQIHAAPRTPGSLSLVVRGHRNRIEIEDDLRTDGPALVKVTGDDNVITLGPELRLRDTRLTVEGHRNHLRFGAECSGQFLARVKSDGATCVLGEHCTAGTARMWLHEPACMTLGDDCMLASNVRLMVSDMHPIIDLDSGECVNPAADVHIGDHVWIGVGAIVLKGVTIGSGAIVGAAAVVTRSIPSNCVAAGNPARVIRENVAWTRKRTSFFARAHDTIES
jgi:acetyltransferase-like isoleucine patch superfamily enzyme